VCWLAGAPRSADNPELAAQQAARVALGRLGEVDDVVSIIAFRHALPIVDGSAVTGT
jgi:hypothetical protein